MTAEPDQAHVTAFGILVSLDQRSRLRAGSMVGFQDDREGWTGVQFRIREHQLLAPMSEIQEIVPLALCTEIPSTRSWLLGVMNLRGNLLPVVDLEGYFYGENLSSPGTKGRLLVVQYAGFPVGLLVRSVQGMKHYRREDAAEEIPRFGAPFDDFLGGSYERHQETFAVLDIPALLSHENFRQVTA
jgi:twitching motility protein PilI